MNFYITGTRRGLGEALACKYGNIEKAALDIANNQLFYQGVNTTIVRFGYFDSPRVANVEDKKMSIEYCVEVIDWILQQPHRVKDITVVPD